MNSPVRRLALSVPLLACALLPACAGVAPSPGMMQPATAERGGTAIKPRPPAELPEITPELVLGAVSKGVEILLAMQEGEQKDQWPYEGVYRVNGEIPVGYRIGGTSIAVIALLNAPGYADDKPRQEAVARAVAFICRAREHADMSIDNYEAGYDVRAWGYIEGVLCLARVKQVGAVPAGQEAAVEEALKWYLASLQKIEMPRTGGWNYARPPGAQTAGAPSPFMTGPALQALFEAKALGYEVDAGVVERGLSVLEKARTASGSVMYSGEADAKSVDRISNATPGAVGRMNCTESVLMLAGRSSPDRVRAAVDAFIVHWGWLDQRRAKSGTHLPPYMVAPYYFMFAHQQAAQAVEMLPRTERAEYRRRIHELMFSVRAEDGSWNDRVFRRSAAFGTATAMLVLMQPDLRPAAWPAPAPKPAPAP